jgi:hypothetical protein
MLSAAKHLANCSRRPDASLHIFFKLFCTAGFNLPFQKGCGLKPALQGLSRIVDAAQRRLGSHIFLSQFRRRGGRNLRMQLKITAALRCLLVTLAAITFPRIGRCATSMTIENKQLRVTVNESGAFSIDHLATGRKAIAAGTLACGAGTLKQLSINDRTLGDGQAIDIAGAGSAGARVSLFADLPFALLRLTLGNTSGQAQVQNRVPIASFSVDLGASDLTTLGTGGLAPADKNPGSYVWLAVAQPQSRRGVVTAWLTHDRASGVLFTKADGNRVGVEARSDYGRLRILPGKTADSETLSIGYFDDARLGLEQWADAVARVYAIKLPPQPAGYCTWYSERHGGAGDEKSMAELADFCQKELEPWGFGFLQIDDRWQLGDARGNGPKKNFNGFNPGGPYPSGMKAIADKIKAHGLVPGLWFMPFAGTHNDPWFADKQDLFVKRENGEPYDTAWGGTCLDMTNPKTREYVRSIVSRITHEWGFTYLKMDGLWTGLAAKQVYVNAGYREDDLGDAVFSDPDKTNIEAFRDGMKLVREAAGKDVFFLGCNMAQDMRVFGAGIGLFDAMRVGPDNGGNWQRWVRSPFAASRNYFLNGRIWYNDPDPQYVRASIPLADARTIASWHAITGGLNTNSDWLPGLPPERLDLLKRTMPAHGKTARPVDYFEHDPPRIWVVSDETGKPRRDVLAIFNFSDAPEEFDLAPDYVGLPPATSYAAFDYWANQFLPPISGHIKMTLEPHGCKVLAIRAIGDHPFVLSTSRHITQGMTDLIEQRWDAASKTLTGKSQIVAGDSYELRIWAPSGLKATSAQISQDDRATGATIQADNAPSGFRAMIKSPESQVLAWTIDYAQ